MTNAIVLRYKDRALLFFLHSLLSRNVNRPRSLDRGHNGRRWHFTRHKKIQRKTSDTNYNGLTSLEQIGALKRVCLLRKLSALQLFHYTVSFVVVVVVHQGGGGGGGGHSASFIYLPFLLQHLLFFFTPSLLFRGWNIFTPPPPPPP